jgi:hypothetical protein
LCQLRKVIATTDNSLTFETSMYDKIVNHLSSYEKLFHQIPESFIIEFIYEFNNKNIITEVLVEYVCLCDACGMEIRDFGCVAGCGKKYTEILNINPRNNTIIIKN